MSLETSGFVIVPTAPSVSPRRGVVDTDAMVRHLMKAKFRCESGRRPSRGGRA